MFRRIVVALGLALLTSSAGASGRTRAEQRYVDMLVQRARSLKLAEQPAWLRLVHYRRGLFGGFASEADGWPFFLARDGKTNPEAELEATLRGFFGPAPKDARLQHPYCRFPARFAWLDRELGISRAKLPPQRCAHYEEFLDKLRPSSATLVFSSYYLNNPSSAFGHTFLRINKTRPRAGDRQELLDYGVDYSATVDTHNALLYAVKGLFGLFAGDFRKIPYYYKVREYNDFESRDLWEYDLDLTPEQVRLLVAHLWELGSTYFAYYYLTENCSYHMLGLLEVADPKLDLISRLGWPVLPADTVKVLFKNPGLVRAIHYRPSNRTQFRRSVEQLNSEELDAVARLMHQPNNPFPASFSVARRVKVLDTAIDLIDMRSARELGKQRKDVDAESAAIQQALLERRAEHLVETEPPRFVPPITQQPHSGHDSRRLGLGSGYERTRHYYHLASFRVALHDLVDAVPGYPESAEIEFLPGTIRYYIESPLVSLEELSLIRVKSFSPLSRFDRSLSWLIDAGAKRSYDQGCDGCLAGFGELGVGFTVGLFGRFLTLHALADAELYAPHESGYLDVFRLAIGPRGFVKLRFSDELALLASGSWHYLPAQDPDRTWLFDGRLRYSYYRNFAFGVEARMYPSTAWLQGVSYLYF
jgi:Domain of unknown function (DUF4105)